MSAAVERLEALSQFGRHERGIDRALATPQERAARERFAAWATASGYALRQDRVGNLFARRPGARAGAKPILVGSHLDTVPTGGAYDGAYGVVAALCALEALDASATATEHPVEAVAWAGEEGARFPLGCLGSSVFTGAWPAERALALRDANGTTLGDALAAAECGLLGGVPVDDDRACAAYLELHVEQGPVLEREGVALGIVTVITGQRRYRVVLDGTSGHAGTVPMRLRADPLVAACELVITLEQAAILAGETVATVGMLAVEPGAPNVIPARVRLSVDIRSTDDAKIESVERAMRDTATVLQDRRHVVVSIERSESRLPAPMDENLRTALARAVASIGERAISLPSGAGHDAMCLSRVAPTAMLFVPSIGGQSHVAQEATSPEHVDLGVRALTAAIAEVDRIVL